MISSGLLHKAELALPGAAIGMLTGVIAGAMTAAVGLPLGWALAAMLGLGVPMALFGAGYSVLLATGVFRPGVFAPAALYWLVAFPVARLVHEATTHLVVAGRVGLTDDVLSFLAFQGLVSVGFAIGFVWLHERLAPHWLLKIRQHNPEAQRLFNVYVSHAETVWEEKARSQARRKPTKAGQRPA